MLVTSLALAGCATSDSAGKNRTTPGANNDPQNKGMVDRESGVGISHAH